MICKPSPCSGRRILSCPAVRPCESVYPRVLLASLIDLGSSICSCKSMPLSSNRHNILDTLRNVGNLLVFLEEIDPGEIPDSALLGLSEVHLAFQNIRFLVEDCTRDGSRLWMLMNAEHVAHQFRILNRSMAIALDVLPLELIHVPEEAKELVELVARQSRKVQFGLDPCDLEVISFVNSVLAKFEAGVVPRIHDLVRFLGYVGIGSWIECNEEVRLLNLEIGLESSREDKSHKEIELLSSLIGFMSYCRCVCFDVSDSDHKANRSNAQSNAGDKSLGIINADDLRCPISLEFMSDPVTTMTGHTYDRSSILKWFRAGNPICPKTGKKLSSKELIPNLTIRRLIEQYCFENGIPVPESSGSKKNRDIMGTAIPGSRAAEGAMKLAASYLAGQLKDGTHKEMNKAAREIRVLAKSSIFNRSCLTEAGNIPRLLPLLYSEDASAQENAIAALLNLSKHSKSKAIIVDNGGLMPVIEVLEKGLKVESRHHAAATLFYLASIEKYRKLIGEVPRTIPVLVEMVTDGTPRGKKNALVAIFGLLTNGEGANHRRVLSAGLVPLLAELLKSRDREYVLVDALAVLSSLAERRQGASAMLAAGAMHIVKETLRTSSSRTAKEYCVALLLSLCINGGKEEAVAGLIRSSSLMECLYSLLEEGTLRARRKASLLIGLLQEFNRNSLCGSLPSVFQQEQIIHAL